MNSNASPIAQIASLLQPSTTRLNQSNPSRIVRKQVIAESGSASITYLSRGAAAAASTVPSTANCNK
ncbi:unnamed protein product [Phytophthora lilii]|uniref:Unnamed protein product n=1 Tax=Phytophthora lilii TaxID=2077276 RepID=A0A9W6X6H8_9STRA|nr:unnamed protein product [Phytophthora lilii]